MTDDARSGADVAMPAQVVVAGHALEVIAVDDPSSGLAAHTKPHAIGSTDVERSRVYVRVDQAQSISNRRDTLMHEVVHAVLMLYGYVDRETDVFKSERAGERVVDILGTGLVDVLRRNPAMVDYLMAGANDRLADFLRDDQARWDKLQIEVQNLDANYARVLRVIDGLRP